MNHRKMEDALRSIGVERYQQEQAKLAGKFTHTCDDVEMTDAERLAVLVEEVGEVASEVLCNTDEVQNREGNWDDVRQRMRGELVQVAAVATAWLESF